jgi:adenosylcobinamide-phosphate synthase
MSIASNLSVLLVALLVEAAFGYPVALQEAIRHPVMWIGDMIAWLDKTLNIATLTEDRRRINGILALAAILAVVIIPAVIVQIAMIDVLPDILAILLLGIGASSLFAQRSLWLHVAAVARGLEKHGLAGGRAAVSRIVGRDPDSLDEAAVSRAAIESLAENFSDGIVAPAFWCVLFGLPGIAAYKAINTADSMIGHRTERHSAFGWAAARLDDLVNLPASRLSAVWIALAAMMIDTTAGAALKTARRDARHHRSPNAGWPEAAMAGALGLRLAGPRVYGNDRVDDRWMGDGRAEATAADIRRALDLYRVACGLQIATLALLVGLIWIA